MEPSKSNQETTSPTLHRLNNRWALWAHLPHDTDWTIASYKHISTFGSVEEIIALNDILPEKMVKNCMLFLMKEGIQPTWEDPNNRKGGCFSYRVINKIIKDIWCSLSYVLVGNTLSNETSFNEAVNGITVSPKKNFCILKIWMNSCSHQNPKVIESINGIGHHGCIFKKHIPEY